MTDEEWQNKITKAISDIKSLPNLAFGNKLIKKCCIEKSKVVNILNKLLDTDDKKGRR